MARSTSKSNLSPKDADALKKHAVHAFAVSEETRRSNQVIEDSPADRQRTSSVASDSSPSPLSLAQVAFSDAVTSKMTTEQRFLNLETHLVRLAEQLAEADSTNAKLRKLCLAKFRTLDDLRLSEFKAEYASLKDAFDRRENANPYEGSELTSRLDEMDAYMDIIRNDLDALRKGEGIAARSPAAASTQFADPQHRQVFNEVKAGSPTAISLFLGRQE